MEKSTKIGRPRVPAREKKVRESIYFDPEVREWLRVQARGASISPLVNRLVKEAKGRSD